MAPTHGQAMAERLEALIIEFPTEPLPEHLPPAPTMRLKQVNFRGDGYAPFSAEGGWPTTRPPTMQSTTLCRRCADLDYLRHGHLSDLDLKVAIGADTDHAEWMKRRRIIQRRVSVLHGKLAGRNSFLVATLTSEIMMHNSKTAAHNYYLKGRQIQIDAPASESVEARDIRLLTARAHISKAERTILELQTWIQEQVATEEALLVDRKEEEKSDTITQTQEYKISWARKYNEPLLSHLRACFANTTKLPDALVPIAAKTPVEFNAFIKYVFGDRDRVFSVYAAFEECNHMKANLKKGKARILRFTHITVMAKEIWRHIVSPKLQMRAVVPLSDPVVRASIVVESGVGPVYAAIENLDGSANFSKRDFGGVEIIMVQRDARDWEKRACSGEVKAGAWEIGQ